MMKAPHLSYVERANELLAQMTIAEKTRQVSAVQPNVLLGSDGLDSAAMREHIGLGVGHISNVAFTASSPTEIGELACGVQRFLVEETRLGIPALLHTEGLNGFVAPGFTSFPTAIGLAATWNPDSIGQMAGIVRRQMQAVGVRQALSPVLDIARDARWGRIHETYGEDVYLTSAMGVAFIKGMQTDDLTNGVLATAKHFLGYGMTEAGQNMAATHLGPRELYDVYATPFEAAIHLADLGSIMNSYSEIDGVPVAASYEILTELLRGRMGFKGSVVSDYNTVEWLQTRQFAAETATEAGVLALSAGLDVELPVVVGYGHHLEDAIKAGRLSEDVLDEAVRRVLLDKFKLGLFDNPFTTFEPSVVVAVAAEGEELSSSLAEESITLLKNTGVLPMQPVGRIAVIGPNADDAMANFAAYTFPAMLDMFRGRVTGESRMAGVESMTESSPEAAAEMQKRAAAIMAIDTEQVARAQYGAKSLTEAIRDAAPEAHVESVTGVGIHPDDPQNIDAAVSAAAAADVVVLAFGGRAGWFGTRITEGEGTDMANVELPAHQVALVRALAATSTPLVGVMFQGRPYALSEIDDLLSALLVAYYPGPRGGAAIASVLFGETNPGGKLPYSLPRATGQVPLYYGQKHGSGYRRSAGDMFRNYIDLEPTPLYPFGHGLSYTAFEYGELEVESAQVPTEGGRIRVSVDVRNSGSLAGSEVVQIYVSDTATALTRPAMQLVGFQKVEIPAGGEVTVSCDIETSQLGYSGVDGRFVIEPGALTIMVGSSSEDIRNRARVELVGEATDLEGRRAYLSETQVLSPVDAAAR